MEIIYTIITINGDYATAMSNRTGDTTNIALALLPCDICEGDILLFKDFEYSYISRA